MTNIKHRLERVIHSTLLLRKFRALEFYGQKIYTPDSGSILRYYAPFLNSYPDGYAITGKIGLHLPEFEESWRLHGGNEPYLPLGMLIDNCPRIYYVPRFADPGDPGIPAWIDSVLREVFDLPVQRRELASMVKNGCIGDYPIRNYFLPNPKSDAAVNWMRL